MDKIPRAGAPSQAQIIAAFAAIYLIWGSTYLAIRFAVETMPPFLMAGVRFLIAGAALYAWVSWRGVPAPRFVHWIGAGIVGGLLLLGGNGAVVWAEQRVASGVTALLIATVPLWIVLLDWARRGGVRPTGRLIAGLALGFAGMVLLMGPEQFAGGERIDLVGATVLVLGSLSWAAGSLYSRRAHLPASPLLATAMQMLAGGALLVLAGTAAGEWDRLALEKISIESCIAFIYLILFGSLVGFTAYIWLLGVVAPARVATYAYVNPIVAVLLGALMAGEPLTPRTLLAAAVIVGGVVAITTERASASETGQEPAAQPEVELSRN